MDKWPHPTPHSPRAWWSTLYVSDLRQFATWVLSCGLGVWVVTLCCRIRLRHARAALATLVVACLCVVIAGRGKAVDGLSETQQGLKDLRSTLQAWADAAASLTNCSAQAAGLWDDLEDARRPLKHDTPSLRLLVVVVVLVLASFKIASCVVPVLVLAFTLSLVAAFVVADFCSFRAKDMLDAQSSHNAYIVWTLNDCRGPHPYDAVIANISATCPFDASVAILQSALRCDTSPQRLYDGAVCTDTRDGFALITLALFATAVFTLLFSLVRSPVQKEEQEEELPPEESPRETKNEELPPTPSLQRLLELAKRGAGPPKKTRRQKVATAKVVPNNLGSLSQELTPVESFRS